MQSRDDVIRLAREAGFPEWSDRVVGVELEAFAALVRASVLEEAAQMCESQAKSYARTAQGGSDGAYDHMEQAALDFAGEIRGMKSDSVDPISALRVAAAPGPDRSPANASVPPQGWPCLIEKADFEADTVTLKMQCDNYRVGAGPHMLFFVPRHGAADHEVTGRINMNPPPISGGECVHLLGSKT